MKKYIKGLLIILFILLLALGGLFLPILLMDRQQNALFAKTETIHLPTTEDTASDTFIQFAPEDLLSIAASYGQVMSWSAYNSTEEDMTTEFLIQTTQEQINQLCQLGILPEIFLDANYTWINIERGTTWIPSESYSVSSSVTEQDYNGWIAICGNGDLSIRVHINSSSGQIFSLNASWYRSEDSKTVPHTQSYIFEQYLNYLELSDVSYLPNVHNDFLWGDDYTYYWFGDYNIGLLVQQNSIYDQAEHSNTSVNNSDMEERMKELAEAKENLSTQQNASNSDIEDMEEEETLIKNADSYELQIYFFYN